MAEIIENFHGVYLLYCKNPQYLGRTYIGYTVDPNRRIKQHNKGRKAGGAYRTSKNGPWSMAMIIHGFPNNISALRFEWAWQHPLRSRRLKHISRKSKENTFQYNLRVLSEMLRVGPWNRLPLTIRWFDDELHQHFPIDKLPPMHMPISYGRIKACKVSVEETNGEIPQETCIICSENVESNCLKCLKSNCTMRSHLECLAEEFLGIGEYIPIAGQCPSCKTSLLWGDLVRQLRGCYGNLQEMQPKSEENSDVIEDLWSSSDSD